MKHPFRKLLIALSGSLLIPTALVVPDAAAFSLLGPFDTWQVPVLNYNRNVLVFPLRSPRGNEIGGPQNLGEEYRRNVSGLFYAYDYSFLDYFGARGMEEVDKAVKILDDLPPFSTMSEDLSEFPLDTQRINFRASALSLVDLKSYALGLLVYELGLLSPHQYAWTMRNRDTANRDCPFFAYWFVRRSFDPVTWEPTSYINGALYTFALEWSCPPGQDVQEASEIAVDPLAFNWSAVAENDGMILGGYYSGLTRDDVGGLRYIYRGNNFNYEPLPANVTLGASGGGSPWSPVNPNITNTPVAGASATIGGIDKLSFTKVFFDGLLGQTFTTVSNSYTVPVAVDVQTGVSFDGSRDLNIQVQSVSLTRVATFPDIVFYASDGLDATGFVTTPVYGRSTDYQRNNGPGTMEGTLAIGFSKIGPYTVDDMLLNPFVSEATSTQQFRFGAFDGSTNPPVIFPSGTSIREMEQLILGGN